MKKEPIFLTRARRYNDPPDEWTLNLATYVNENGDIFLRLTEAGGPITGKAIAYYAVLGHGCGWVDFSTHLSTGFVLEHHDAVAAYMRLTA